MSENIKTQAPPTACAQKGIQTDIFRVGFLSEVAEAGECCESG